MKTGSIARPDAFGGTSAVAVLLAVVGLLQTSGHLLGLPALAAFGAATAASPAPGGRASSTSAATDSLPLFLEWQESSGPRRSIRMTAVACEGIRGPAARRNMYRAVLACGAIGSGAPTQAMREAVARQALCGPAPLLRELGFAPDRIEHVRLRAEGQPLHGESGSPLLLDIACNP